MIDYKNIKISVLIATFNRKSLFDRCLYHLICKSNTLPDEIVVVIGAKDGSVEVAKYYQRIYKNLKYIEIINKSLGNSQNVGIKFCTGDVIATLDDDAFVFTDWAENVKKAHVEHPEAGCIGGRIINYYPDKIIARLESHIGMPYDEKERKYTRTIAGVSCTYKKLVMKKIGKFDETLPAGMDTDYNWRISKSGYKILFEPNIKLYHCNRTELNKFLKQQNWYGRGYFLVRKKNKDLYSFIPQRFNTIKDFAKLIIFFISILFMPLFLGLKANNLVDKISFPLLIFLKEIWWRRGYFLEYIKHKT